MCNLIKEELKIAEYSSTINQFKEQHVDALRTYIDGLIKMAMRDLNYTDTDIAFVCDEVCSRVDNTKSMDVVEYAIECARQNGARKDM